MGARERTHNGEARQTEKKGVRCQRGGRSTNTYRVCPFFAVMGTVHRGKEPWGVVKESGGVVHEETKPKKGRDPRVCVSGREGRGKSNRILSVSQQGKERRE